MKALLIALIFTTSITSFAREVFIREADTWPASSNLDPVGSMLRVTTNSRSDFHEGYEIFAEVNELANQCIPVSKSLIQNFYFCRGDRVYPVNEFGAMKEYPFEIIKFFSDKIAQVRHLRSGEIRYYDMRDFSLSRTSPQVDSRVSRRRAKWNSILNDPHYVQSDAEIRARAENRRQRAKRISDQISRSNAIR